MLLRPPFMKEEDVKSQSSNGISHMDKQHSVKSSSKNKKKQNSLGMRKNNIVGMQYEANNILNTQNNYDSDTGSVHSINSRKSKGKTKESTLAIGKKDSSYVNINQNSTYSSKNQNNQQEYEIFKLDSDDDNKSIGSQASKNSRKNTVKENSLGKNRNSRANVQLGYYQNKSNSNQYHEEKEQTPPKTYYLEEESKVQTVKLNENPSPAPVIKYNQALKTNPVVAKNPEQRARRTEQPKPKQVLSPFQEITLKKQSDQEEPVYKLKEPQPNHRNQNKVQNNIFGQRIQENQQPQFNPFQQKNPKVDLKVDLQESSTIQPQMVSTKSVTKSRRNKIFDDNNNSIANSSNINSSRNMDGSFERSRSKSKSKLGDLLKESKDKKEELAKSRQKEMFTKPTPQAMQMRGTHNFFESVESKPQKINPKQSYESTNNLINIQESNLVSVSNLPEQSRIGGGQKLGYQHQGKMEQIKPKSIQNQVFDLGQSRESHMDLNLSMSNRQPEFSGIKGDSVHFNFEPERKKGLTITSKQKPAGSENKSLESKKHLDRLMKKCQENEEFLAKSILSNNSELRNSQKPILPNGPLPQGAKKEETLNRAFEKPKEKKIEEEEPSWCNMVKEEPAFQIKQVQRKEIRRPSQEEIRLEQRHKQVSQDYVPTPTAKSPQQLFGNPLSRPGFEQREENFYREQIDQQKAQEQKNRILANIQKKSKTQKQTQNIQIVQNRPAPQSRQNPMNKRREDRPKERNLPFQQPEPQYTKEQVQSSTISHELSLSENGSERSNSQKKNKKKESSLNIMKKHKVQVRDQSPRAEESFYEQRPQSPEQNAYKHKEQVRQNPKTMIGDTSIKMESSRTKIESGRRKQEYKKPNLINFQESEPQEEEKVKSKTDINFYNYGEMSQKSMRPPSSKPPLSRKSGASSSKSKSKAKESTLNINMTKKDNKIKIGNADSKNSGNNKPEQKKKKTLLEIAQDKSYEGSGYGGSDSQCSFNSRESFGSVNSKGSRKSSSSKKESTLPITIKNKATKMGNFHPSLNKISSQVQIYENEPENQSIYNQLPQQSLKKTSRQRQQDRHYEEMQHRTIVSKDTYFIDERGRLVKQDLIIQGKKVYGRNSNQSAEQMAMERMRRSREYHRSRSKSRDGSRSRVSKKNSMTSFGGDSQYTDSRASSSNYFNGQQSNYNNERQNLYIEEFVKPVQEPMPAHNGYKFQKPAPNNQRKIEREFYENQEDPYNNQRNYKNQQYDDEEEDEPVRNITLNELFGRNKNPPQPAGNGKTMYNQQSNVSSYNSNQRSKYQNTNGNGSKFGQQSRQSNRKKSLSRTEKAFHNR